MAGGQVRVEPSTSPLRRTLTFLLAAILSSCASTLESRIQKRQKTFDALPAETQKKIKAGEVEVGFTEDMVFMALGKPDRTYRVTTEKGEATVWAYTEGKPGVGLSLGLGTGLGSSTYGGVSVGTGTGGSYEKTRISFQDGKVVSLERR